MNKTVRQSIDPRSGNKGVNSFAGKFLVREFGKNDCCRRCGRKMVKRSKFDRIAYQINEDVTVDHVYSKMDLRRLIPGCNKMLVLCCYKCNQDRNNIEKRLVFNTAYKEENNKINILDLLNETMNKEAADYLSPRKVSSFLSVLALHNYRLRL